MIKMETIQDAINFINERDNPLAFYMFSTDNAAVEQVMQSTSSGSFCQNDCMTQLFAGTLPLGGVGASGHGRYKGRWSFEAFSHYKAVLRRPANLEFVNDWSRNPPLNDSKYNLLSYALLHRRR